MLSPLLVGDIAHCMPPVAELGTDDAHALVRHSLAFAWCAAADASGAVLADSESTEVLRQAARTQSFRSIAVASTATRAFDVLASAGVRSLVYKGPPLAVQTTGSWQGRGSADVDVLVDPRDCEATDRALRGAGCVSRVGHAGPPSGWERYHRPERAYSGLPVTVDLHWRIDPGPGYFSARFDDLWRRREHVVSDGLAVDTLDHVDALLATAVHGSKERWARWSWPLDAVRQVEGLEAAQWGEVKERAAATGARRAVDLCLAVATVCGARMPQGVAATPAMLDIARAWMAASAPATSVEWSNSAALSRRRARWLVADSPVVAADSFLRAAARLIADRRAPWAPQRRPDPDHG